jgi:hypothetical protein
MARLATTPPRGFNVFIEPIFPFISERAGIAPSGRYPAIDRELVYIRGAHTYTKLMQGLPRSVGFILIFLKQFFVFSHAIN